MDIKINLPKILESYDYRCDARRLKSFAHYTRFHRTEFAARDISHSSRRGVIRVRVHAVGLLLMTASELMNSAEMDEGVKHDLLSALPCFRPRPAVLSFSPQLGR
jgi:hypothetical protein